MIITNHFTNMFGDTKFVFQVNLNFLYWNKIDWIESMEYSIYMGQFSQFGDLLNLWIILPSSWKPVAPSIWKQMIWNFLWLTITHFRHSRAKESQVKSKKRDQEEGEKISYNVIYLVIFGLVWFGLKLIFSPSSWSLFWT